ncbi:MAG: M48 family metallopeptidase, partial [Xanthobacteraceae bacterium]
RVVIFSLAAIASLVLTAIFGMPVLANRITPLIPLSMEKKLGEAVDKQIGPLLDTGSRGAAFQCGNGVAEVPGRKALDKLVRQLETTARLPYRIRVDVVRRQQANAFALPGGHVYVFEGLLAKSRAPDELAGVIAHEIGHVVRRDGTRAVLQSAGLSFLFGMMLGDFVGGGAVVIAARTVLNSSYSRHAEAAADDYSVKLMENAGGDPRALGAILSRIASDKYDGMTLLRDHPDTKDRIAAINSVTVENLPKQLLNATEWKALKAICSPLPPDGKPQDGKPADQPKR